MAIKPDFSPFRVTNTNTLSNNDVFINAVRFSYDVSFFQRTEFSNQLLRSAPEPGGQVPVFNALADGRQMQYISACAPTTARSLSTDDNNIDNIFRRWDIKKWEIQGAASNASAVDAIAEIAKNHKVLLNRFETHLQIARGFVSYEFLHDTLQVETFNYLEVTGINMSAQSLGVGSPTEVTNILITSFVPDVEVEETLNSAGDSSTILRSFSAVIEQRVNVPARSVTY